MVTDDEVKALTPDRGSRSCAGAPATHRHSVPAHPLTGVEGHPVSCGKSDLVFVHFYLGLLASRLAVLESSVVAACISAEAKSRTFTIHKRKLRVDAVENVDLRAPRAAAPPYADARAEEEEKEASSSEEEEDPPRRRRRHRHRHRDTRTFA